MDFTQDKSIGGLGKVWLVIFFFSVFIKRVLMGGRDRV